MAKPTVSHEFWKFVAPGYLLRSRGRLARRKSQQGFRRWLHTGLVAKLQHAGPHPVKRIDW